MKLKITYAISMLLFLSFTLKAGDESSLKWHSFDAGLAKAVKENKLVLVDFYTDWCGWCKKMDATTYEDKKVIEFLNANFVAVKLNPEKEGSVNFQGNKYSHGEFSAAAGVKGFPATAFFTHNSEFIRTFPGYMDTESFLDLLEKLVEATKKS